MLFPSPIIMVTDSSFTTFDNIPFCSYVDSCQQVFPGSAIDVWDIWLVIVSLWLLE